MMIIHVYNIMILCINIKITHIHIHIIIDIIDIINYIFIIDIHVYIIRYIIDISQIKKETSLVFLYSYSFNSLK